MQQVLSHLRLTCRPIYGFATCCICRMWLAASACTVFTGTQALLGLAAVSAGCSCCAASAAKPSSAWVPYGTASFSCLVGQYVTACTTNAISLRCHLTSYSCKLECWHHLAHKRLWHCAAAAATSIPLLLAGPRADCRCAGSSPRPRPEGDVQATT